MFEGDLKSEDTEVLCASSINFKRSFTGLFRNAAAMLLATKVG